ncbi:MAG TPA: hypothetical protein VK163_14255 [Opitutaceae bacterium]|nr:hypothetical protein [Opitutaceae bacterium]
MNTQAVVPTNSLVDIATASALIRQGVPLCLAGSAEAIAQLPAGAWIAGTIPYFMAEAGGVKASDRLFVTRFPEAEKITFAAYEADAIEQIVPHTPENGFAFAITPCGCAALNRFALEGRDVEGAFLKPVVGWIAGVDLDRAASETPQVFLGTDRRPRKDGFVVAHVTLPEGKLATLSIVNIFQPDGGDTLRFVSSGYKAVECLVNGAPRRLADYLRERNNETGRLPLVGDLGGALINVSIKDVDPVSGQVTFYAPVFADTDYQIAKPVSDYAAAFDHELRASATEPSAFACNCILNYLHGSLEGRSTGGVHGPITFGEIAYQLLNQTLVMLHIH